jgi:hypothetical protein
MATYLVIASLAQNNLDIGRGEAICLSADFVDG